MKPIAVMDVVQKFLRIGVGNLLNYSEAFQYVFIYFRKSVPYLLKSTLFYQLGPKGNSIMVGGTFLFS